MPRREVDPDIYCPQAALVDKETADRVERRLATYRAKVKAQRQQQHNIIMMKQQQQRMIWMGSGAMLLMAASCWIWYKKSNKKQQQKRRRTQAQAQNGNNEEDIDPELQHLFNEACKAARQLKKLDQRDQLMMYGLYKQAQQGDADDNTNTAPSKLDVVAHAKYNAWKKFTGLPRHFAMEKYCEVVYHFLNGGSSSFTDGEQNDDDDDNDDDDIVYHDDDEHEEEELDEDGCPIHQEDNTDDNNYLDSGMMGIRQSTLSSSTNNVLPNNNNNELLLQSESSPDIRLRNAALSNNITELEQAIRDGANLDDTDESGQTALHFSADKGCIDCIRVLLTAGANVNAADQLGIGVLQTAVVAGILDVEGIRVLLEGGADPDAEDDDGDSPRSTVLDEGRSELVELFDLYPSK